MAVLRGDVSVGRVLNIEVGYKLSMVVRVPGDRQARRTH